MGPRDAEHGPRRPRREGLPLPRRHGCAQTAVGIVALGADQQTRAKLDVIGGATAIGIAGGLAQFDAEKDMGGPVKDVMKYGNIAANLAMGAMMIKRGMDNLDK